ncbi:hypothetical protein DUNSADRAFT_5045 [Dunaliella salina]|uniref:Uncharacterized protein n=1 Tax=Dunaliella salina TaxID=3046 RepID=A0ABQ7HAC8_DUNSA|nr:hypothetical protein DUNSADRAFT_5045 [Dunaliella salina]|eukprot:KAF5843808.1 hypothetical protein DUNSADRAFT_5045 [Dunaliella salina]
MASLVCAATTLKNSKAVWTGALLFSLWRIGMQIGLPEQAPKFFAEANFPAQVMITLLELLILDPHWGAPLLMYFFCHAGTRAFYFYIMEVHCITASISRGFGMHALCLCAFLALHQSRKFLCCLGGLHAESKAAKQQERGDAQGEQMLGRPAHAQQQVHEKEKLTPPVNEWPLVEPAQEPAQQAPPAQKTPLRSSSTSATQERLASSTLNQLNKLHSEAAKQAPPAQELQQAQLAIGPQQTDTAKELSQIELAKGLHQIERTGLQKHGEPAKDIRHVEPAKQGEPAKEGAPAKELQHAGAAKQAVLAKGLQHVEPAAVSYYPQHYSKEQRRPSCGAALHNLVSTPQRSANKMCSPRSSFDLSAAAVDDAAAKAEDVGSSRKAQAASCGRLPVSQASKLEGDLPGKPFPHAMQRALEQQWGSASLPPMSETTASSVSTDSRTSRSSSSASQVSIRSHNASMTALRAAGLASPHAKVALADTLKARAAGRQPYVSKLHEHHGSGAASTEQFVQAACRFAVKVNGPSLPGNVPSAAVTQLQQRLSRYQRLMSAEPPAMRAGCLVVSYGALLEQSSLPDMSKEAVAVGQAWAEEHGLLLGEEDRLTVQACRQSSWSSSHALYGQPFPPEHSIIMHEPFIEASPPDPNEKCTCTFDLTLIAPAHFELRGWHGAADAPEELPNKDRSLCLLASIDGPHVRTHVEQRSMGSLGERHVQVRVSFAGVFDAVSSSPKVLVLELWASGALVCSYSAMCLPSLYAGAQREMHDWIDHIGSNRAEESAMFMRDLVVWMYHQANIATFTSADDDESQHQLALLATVGMDLLGHSLQHGMSALAGLLLNGLISAALYTPPSDQPTCGEAPASGHTDNNTREVQTPSAVSVPVANPEEHPRREVAQLRKVASNESNPPCLARVLQQQQQQLQGSADTPVPDSAHICLSASTSAASTSHPAEDGTEADASRSSRGGLPEASPPGEAEYRAWSNAQVSKLAKTWCRVWVLNISLGVGRAWTRGRPPLLELSSWGVMLLVYTLGALFIRPGCPRTEIILAAITIARVAYGTMIGTGLVPLSSSLALVFHHRIEACIEAFMMPVMERVRLSWALPLRALLTISVALMYMRLDFPWPVAQSVLVNLCGLGVTAAIECRERRLYLSSRLHAKKQACADEGSGCGTSRKPKSC